MKDLLSPYNRKDRQQKRKEMESEVLHAVTFLGNECADAAVKWGARFAQKDHIAILRTKGYELGQDVPDITVIADTRTGKQTMFVIAGDQEGMGFHNLTEPKTLDIPLPGGQVEVNTGLVPYIQDKEPGILSWDMNLQLNDVAKVLKTLDEKAAEQGLFDRGTKVRSAIPKPQIVPLPKFKVDEVFSVIGMSHPTFDENPEILLEQFDKPEDLSIQEDELIPGISVFSIVHKRDLEFINKRHQVAEKILAEKGFSPQDFSEGLIRAPKIFNPLVMQIRLEVLEKTQNLVVAEDLRRKPKVEDKVFKTMQQGLIDIYEGHTLKDEQMFENGRKSLYALMEDVPEVAQIPHALGIAISRTTRDWEEVYGLFSKAVETDRGKSEYFFDLIRCIFIKDPDLNADHANEIYELFLQAQKLGDFDDYLDDLWTDESLMMIGIIQKANLNRSKYK